MRTIDFGRFVPFLFSALFFPASLSAGLSDEGRELQRLVGDAQAARASGDLVRARDLYSEALKALGDQPGQQSNIALRENQLAAIDLAEGEAAAAQAGFARAVGRETDAARAAQ